jgi:lipopolysaccharide transport system permease protein
VAADTREAERQPARASGSAWALLGVGAVAMLWFRRDLIRQLLAREIVQRYRGSYLGATWSLVTPLLVLAVYTFVFSTVFQVRWNSQDAQAQPAQFALLLFAGLIPFNAFSETLARGPTLIIAVPNYVKKIVFPLEVLPVVAVGSALFQSLMSVIVLLLMTLIFQHSLPLSLSLLPLAYLPLMLLSLGCAWLLASLGVYVRDISQAITAIIQVLVFISPVFYPASAVPEELRWILYLNPLTPVLEAFRGALVSGVPFVWQSWLGCTLVSTVVAALGYAWFLHTRNGFSDVL